MFGLKTCCVVRCPSLCEAPIFTWMKPTSLQHLWSSATFTGALKAFGCYPAGISCAGPSFSREGLEVSVLACPSELCSPVGSDIGPAARRAPSPSGVRPLRGGWEHTASPPALLPPAPGSGGSWLQRLQCQPGSCREWMDVSPGARLPLLSLQ